VVRHDRWHCAIVRGPLVALLEGAPAHAGEMPRTVASRTAAPADRSPAAPSAAASRRVPAVRELDLVAAAVRRPVRAAAAPVPQAARA